MEPQENSAYQREFDRLKNDTERALRSLTLLCSLPNEALEGMQSVYCFASGDYKNIGIDAEKNSAFTLVDSLLKHFKVKTATKKFSELSGSVIFTFTTATGVIVTVTSSPARCEVESYEETVEVPAKQETRTKFRLKNPEECLKGELPTTEINEGDENVV